MIGPTLKRKGGRPCLPAPPENASECRTLIAAETVKAKPREQTLRALYKLLKAFERAAAQQATDERNRLLADQNRIQAELLALRTAEHRRRFAMMPHGQQQLLKQVETLKAQVKRLELEIAGSSES